MNITIPERSLVILIGPSGSGKSTFAHKHFKSTEILSSDFCRGLVSDDENDQSATKDAFEVLHFVAAKRLAAGKLTVIDATNVQSEARKPLLALAREYHCLPVAIVFNLPEKVCQERNHHRPDRDFGPHVVRQQVMQLRRSLHSLEREGFSDVFVLSSPEQIDSVEIVRRPLWSNLKHEHGPFDIIGDVHGCFDELQILLKRLGYEMREDEQKFYVHHPLNRKALFLGDLVDRGPDIPGVLRLVMDMVEAGGALCIPGNHDVKLLRKLKGRDVKLTHGLAASIEQLEKEPAEFRERVARFIDGLVSHYVLDNGKLVVAHAGLKESMHGRASRAVREFALYGETTGETDEFGMPIRYNWAAEYRGKAMVVYGHTPVPEAGWLNNTINIDTGCVFGGKLTALRYPERELVSVPAARVYWESAKSFLSVVDQATALTVQQQNDDVLDMEDVSGKRIISTRLQQNITIREENAIAALEVMSRFAANPRWLIYLPPTMSPSETSSEPGLLEHPAEAFAYYRHEGVPKVVCEEKHMGSRAVVIVCRDEEAARKNFGVMGEGAGICYTRTGRHFFDDAALEAEMLARVRNALDAVDFWERFSTGWVCMDCELITQYVNAYRQYCWPVHAVTDLKLAPFHLLATQGKVYIDKDHVWHMETLAEICRADEAQMLATPFKIVDVTDAMSVEEGIAWWRELTGRGSEGMVVKPLDFIVRGKRGIVQPALKCRGPEYLRIIYGPEYSIPQNLEQLRKRGLGAKRSLALREFALSVEALERFVRGEPLRRVHECVFGVLALESEPVDPRL